jgi:hypothetical protein
MLRYRCGRIIVISKETDLGVSALHLAFSKLRPRCLHCATRCSRCSSQATYCERAATRGSGWAAVESQSCTPQKISVGTPREPNPAGPSKSILRSAPVASSCRTAEKGPYMTVSESLARSFKMWKLLHSTANAAGSKGLRCMSLRKILPSRLWSRNRSCPEFAQHRDSAPAFAEDRMGWICEPSTWARRQQFDSQVRRWCDGGSYGDHEIDRLCV